MKPILVIDNVNHHSIIGRNTKLYFWRDHVVDQFTCFNDAIHRKSLRALHCCMIRILQIETSTTDLGRRKFIM